MRIHSSLWSVHAKENSFDATDGSLQLMCTVVYSASSFSFFSILCPYTIKLDVRSLS